MQDRIKASSFTIAGMLFGMTETPDGPVLMFTSGISRENIYVQLPAVGFGKNADVDSYSELMKLHHGHERRWILRDLTLVAEEISVIEG